MAYDLVLGPDEKRELLRIARASAAEFLRSGRLPPGKPHRRSLLTNGAAFVALRRRGLGELRGCHGGFEVMHPIYRAIQESAVEAVTADSRFPPVTADELDELILEIAVLGPTTHVGSLGDLAEQFARPADASAGQRPSDDSPDDGPKNGLALLWNHHHAFTTVGSHESGKEAIQRLCRENDIEIDSATGWPPADVHLVHAALQGFDDLRYPPLDPQQIIAQMMGQR